MTSNPHDNVLSTPAGNVGLLTEAHKLLTRPAALHCTPVQLQTELFAVVQPMKFWPAVADAQFVIAALNASRMPAAREDSC
jgi:hypothetical protein